MGEWAVWGQWKMSGSGSRVARMPILTSMKLRLGWGTRICGPRVFFTVDGVIYGGT